MRVSAVVPALDEAATISHLVSRLRVEVDEVVVADGGSVDGTTTLAAEAGAIVVSAPRGRGPQLDAGARAATGEVLWFVHADTTVPPGAGAALRHAAATHCWGSFAVRVESADPRLRWCGRYMTLRARRTGSATGDMGIWCRRALFHEAGGFGARAICEDLDLTDRLRQVEPWAVVPLRLGTSARRWQANGQSLTMLRMWAVRAGYRVGLPESWLVRVYRGRSR
ncbi:MAG: TIGR04283 family arsenosugar biosynthesis glycosyltransferase [Deltaproteobacteria bacterium]|nr:TIGR04283 family arsenosugar biosynthesis glycosyltransferase [Deltaproteobacteria bacterium]